MGCEPTTVIWSSGRSGEWRNGRRAGFRCQCPSGRGGSSPPSPTTSGSTNCDARGHEPEMVRDLCVLSRRRSLICCRPCSHGAAGGWPSASGRPGITSLSVPEACCMIPPNRESFADTAESAPQCGYAAVRSERGSLSAGCDGCGSNLGPTIPTLLARPISAFYNEIYFRRF